MIFSLAQSGSTLSQDAELLRAELQSLQAYVAQHGARLPSGGYRVIVNVSDPDAVSVAQPDDLPWVGERVAAFDAATRRLWTAYNLYPGAYPFESYHTVPLASTPLEDLLPAVQTLLQIHDAGGQLPARKLFKTNTALLAGGIFLALVGVGAIVLLKTRK